MFIEGSTSTVRCVEKFIRFSFKEFSINCPYWFGHLGFQLFHTPIRGYYAIPAEKQSLINEAKVVTLRQKQGHLATYHWGNASSPTVLLIHGWMSSAAQMTTFVKPLLERGFHVVAMDAPAHGSSSGIQTDLQQFSQGIHDVLESLGSVSSIFAHSFGGAASLFLLAQNPEIRPESVVTFGAPANLQYMLFALTKWLKAPKIIQDEINELFMKRYDATAKDFCFKKYAHQLDIPGLVVHDCYDFVTPVDHGRELAAAWPGAKLINTKGLGHAGILEDAQLIQQILAWQEEMSCANEGVIPNPSP